MTPLYEENVYPRTAYLPNLRMRGQYFILYHRARALFYIALLYSSSRVLLALQGTITVEQIINAGEEVRSMPPSVLLH